MKLRIVFALIVTAVAASQGMATSPQKPLATGSIESILPAIEAAYRCGLVQLRLQPSSDGRVRLFVNGEPEDRSAYACTEAWLQENATRLTLYTGF
jgi:hypothetical protein